MIEVDEEEEEKKKTNECGRKREKHTRFCYDIKYDIATFIETTGTVYDIYTHIMKGLVYVN